jgi:hypothetical protein
VHIFDPNTHIQAIVIVGCGGTGAQLIVNCVDNHLARRELHEASGILIGAGNHRDGGQIVIGNTADADLMRRHIDGRNDKYSYLPKEGLLFSSLLEPDPPAATRQPDVSCAELVQRG